MIFSTFKRSYLASNTCKELVIFIKAVSVEEIAIQPMLILSAKMHLKRYFSDLKDNILLRVSETGYNNDELAFKYIYHFNIQTQKY